MVMVTTFLAPPLLRVLFPPVKAEREELPAEPFLKDDIDEQLEN